MHNPYQSPHEQSLPEQPIRVWRTTRWRIIPALFLALLGLWMAGFGVVGIWTIATGYAVLERAVYVTVTLFAASVTLLLGARACWEKKWGMMALMIAGTIGVFFASYWLFILLGPNIQF